MKLAPIAPAGPQATPADGVAQAASWKRALEQALWQEARTRLPQDARPADERAAEHVVDARDLPAARVEDELPAAQVDPRRPPGIGNRKPPTEAVDPDAPATSGGDAVLPRPETAAAAAPSSPPALLRVDPPAARPAQAASAPNPEPPRCEPPQWPPFATHASVSGHRVSASIRDPQLSDAQAQSLRRGLARQLGRAGLELVELRVNGHDTSDPTRS